MARYEVTVHARAGSPPYEKVFTVDAGSDQDTLAYGTTAEDIAHSAAAQYPDSGDVVVRRIGGGERAVVSRKS